MNIRDFMNSRWVRIARNPGTRARILREFPNWIGTVGAPDLVLRARRLKEYLTSSKCSNMDLILAVGALVYLISPLDGMPDFIPFLGWMDDISVAAMVLGYLDKKAAIISQQQFQA